MPVFRSAGISGYVGKRNMMRMHRRKPGFKKRMRFKKRIVKINESLALNKSVYSVVNSYNLKSAVNTVGVQSWQTIAIKNSGADVQAIRGQILAQQANLIVSNQLPEFNINAYIVKIALKNQEQTNAICDLYEVRPRISTLDDPVTALSNIAGQTNGTGINSYTTWGATLFQYPAWCEAFKINRKTRYLLAPGACEMIEIRDTKKQKIDDGRYYAINHTGAQASYADPKYTKYWILCTMGEPTNDSVNLTNVNTSSYKVDVVTREDYHYTYNVSNLNPYNTVADNRGAIANNEQEILVETGAKTVPPTQA